MAKVLVIRKQDKTIHISPIENKASLLAYNNKQSEGTKWKIEEMDEDEAAELPYIDESYVSAAEAVSKSKALTALVNQKDEALSQKDQLIAEMEAKIAALTSNGADTTKTDTAIELIEKINNAATEVEVNELLGTDERKTVIAAAEKRIAALNTK